MKLAMKEITKIVLLAAATAGTLSCTEVAKASTQQAKADGKNSYSILLHGASYHSDQGRTWREGNYQITKRYNQVNLGLGLELEKEYEEYTIVYRTGTYKDSYFKQAFYATIGYRNTFLGDKEGFHVGASVNAGLLYGSGNHGLVATP